MNDSPQGLAPSPFHDGERLAQQRAGVPNEYQDFAARVIRPLMPDQHRKFFTELPFMVVAAKDALQRPWVSMLAGPTGFIKSPDAHTLTMNASFSAGDALSGALSTDSAVGLLGIMLEARRRNRMNGRISAINSEGLTIRVDQSFGNCPQHISARQWVDAPANQNVKPAERTTQLTETMQTLVRGADTFFIASGHQGDSVSPSSGMDASHRGGPVGFVRVVSPTELLIPDYAGNRFFNTIGNLMCDASVGLLFVDFAHGTMLQINGQATIDWDSPALGRFPGAQRLIRVEIEQANLIEHALPIRWQESAGAVRELTLVSKTRESADVTSFEFGARDHGKLLPFTAGQHLPIELKLNDGTAISRSYSLSGPADLASYRISVKRLSGGASSGFLHDHLEPGDAVLAQAASGDFVLTDESRPVVLISAGVGVTPMISLLHTLASRNRPVRFVHGAKDGDHHPFANEVDELISQHEHLRRHIAYSQPRPQDSPGKNFDHHGRLDREYLASVLGDADMDADFYLCGPPMMLADLTTWLSAEGVLNSQIHVESF